MSDEENPLLQLTEPYKTDSGIWQHPVLLKEAMNHERVAGSLMFCALTYHAEMTKWLDDNVCRYCNKNVGGSICHCMNDE